MTGIRPYDPRDRDDLYRVCVLTGDSGSDATGRFSREDLLPDVYTGPYLEHDPELAFVVESDDGRAIGYVIATADTREFSRWFVEEWWPGLAPRYEPSDAERPGERGLVESVSAPGRMLIAAVDDYPAHLHIDLLPETQGRGMGRRLIERLAAALRERGIPGVHLTAGSANTGAIAFYERLGFEVLERGEGHVTFGMRL